MLRISARVHRSAIIATILISLLAETNWLQAASEVSNLTNLTSNGATLNFNDSLRTGIFTTGATSSSWTLASVDAKLDGFNPADATVQMALYSDGGTQPGTLLETLGGNPNPSGVNIYSFTSAGAVLSPNTTYWLVLGKPTGTAQVDWEITNDFSQTSPDGWTIADRFGFYESSAGWGQNGLYAAQFSVNVVPEPGSLAMLAIAGIATLRRTRRSVGKTK